MKTFLARFFRRQPGPPRPARIVLEDGPTPEEIERVLGGTANSPIVKAIIALVSRELVKASDQSMDPPREQAVAGNQVFAGFTADMRLHIAGGGAALAELLRQLQELTAHRKEAPDQAPPEKP